MNKYQVMMFLLGRGVGVDDCGGARAAGPRLSGGPLAAFILFGVYFTVLVMAFVLRYAEKDNASNTNESPGALMETCTEHVPFPHPATASPAVTHTPSPPRPAPHLGLAASQARGIHTRVTFRTPRHECATFIRRQWEEEDGEGYSGAGLRVQFCSRRCGPAGGGIPWWFMELSPIGTVAEASNENCRRQWNARRRGNSRRQFH
ncbi:hypothetical protein GWK47_028735 [Chionoecetes opilio]|uniref:Uncharacterized protein n=1 Tax=Chionoecetes opilio TaxID=41210 RepID=A0A8J5D3D6_CHIOP|nr:hypothetical protein GWK47_028735 [Chionoecetes opilio]